MADVEAGQVGGEGEHVPINHLRRRRLFFLGIVVQVIGAVVPLGMEIALVELKNPNAFRKVLLMVVPLTPLLPVIAVYIKYKQRRRDKEEGALALKYKFLCINIVALLLYASSFFVLLRTLYGWKFGHVFSSYAPIVSAIILFVTSALDLLDDACCA